MYPNEELFEVLVAAYGPCRHMLTHGGGCLQSRWRPAAGHVPRGFLGATGELDDVELVMVLAEPGNPKHTETYVDDLDPADMAQTARTCIYGHLEERNANDPAVSHLEMDDNVPGREHELGRPRHARSVMSALAL